MPDDLSRYLCIAALLLTAALGGWAAWACRRAQLRGQPGHDGPVWAAVALAFLVLGQTKLVRVLGWLTGLGVWPRLFAREHHLYAGRRPYQIAATVIVAIVVFVLMAVGIRHVWDYVRRYRLAIGFAALAVGFAVIRFISLHEVDAWNATWPWLRIVVELTASAGASAVALARLSELGELSRLRRAG